MSNKSVFLAALVGAVFLNACSESDPSPKVAQPAAEPAVEVSAPAAEMTVDPTIADASHYKTEFENDRVRIVRITYGPGETSVMHFHPDNVAVYLTDGTVEMTLPSGETMAGDVVAGTHDFDTAGNHLPKNVSDTPLELVLVELKGGAATAGGSGDDATEVDPGHYTSEFENEQVRVLRIAYGDGEESVMHHHPDSVAVFLTDHRVEMTTPDGESMEISAGAGEAMFIPAGDHQPKNVMGDAWELVLVELK